jgi:hypothetical protein
MAKKTLEEEINEFYELWDLDQLIEFLKDSVPLFELYNIDETDDWVKELVAEEDVNKIRLVRTVYLISRICDRHAGKMCKVKYQFNDLWRRMEQCK